MADFSNIIEEINTNLPDNNNQSITAAKLRTTLIDLTNQIDSEQDDFESQMDTSFGEFQSQVETALDNLIVDNLTSSSASKALSANQGQVLNNKISEIPYNLANPQTETIDFTSTGLTTINFIVYTISKNWGNPENAKSAIIPVSAGDTIYVKAQENKTCHVAFFASYPEPVASEYSGIIDDTIYYVNTTGFTSIDRIVTAPSGANYMYVKMAEQTATYTPAELKITSQKFLTSNDIVDSLDSEDSTKALSANQGPIIGKLQNAIDRTRTISVLQAEQINFVITTATLNWYAPSTKARSAIIPVKAGDKVYVKANIGKTCQIGFFPSYPEPVAGESAGLIDGLYYVNTSGFTSIDRTVTAPSGANYMYVKMTEGQTQWWIPDILTISTPGEKLLIDSYYEDVDSEFDTYIEEDILYYSTSMASGQYRKKFYKINPDINYKLVLYVKASSTANIEYFDSSMTSLGTGYASSSSSDELIEMQDITFPNGTAYISIRCYITLENYTNTGTMALMKPIKNDGTMPKNTNIYCVSKIRKPVLPYNYEGDETTFPNNYIWSAWSFMLPYNVQTNTGKPFPLVSFFHGSSGFLTSEYMGYNASQTSEGIVGNLRKNGCVVFDINGYGISYKSDMKSRHWGCPVAVATVKKAYEILTTRFNCRKGMVISGISMGGAIAKSYCMTYPQDVIACALEAPSEIGCSIRNSVNQIQNGQVTTAWDAWNTDTNSFDKNVFLGYSPLMNPAYIDSSGNIQYKDINTFTYSDWIDTSSADISKPATDIQLYNPFPVEIVIWHGTADTNVHIGYAQLFVRTVRNANCNAKIRVCPGCTHDLNTYPWVMNEVVNYIVDKVNI